MVFLRTQKKKILRTQYFFLSQFFFIMSEYYSAVNGIAGKSVSGNQINNNGTNSAQRLVPLATPLATAHAPKQPLNVLVFVAKGHEFDSARAALNQMSAKVELCDNAEGARTVQYQIKNTNIRFALYWIDWMGPAITKNIVPKVLDGYTHVTMIGCCAARKTFDSISVGPITFAKTAHVENGKPKEFSHKVPDPAGTENLSSFVEVYGYNYVRPTSETTRGFRVYSHDEIYEGDTVGLEALLTEMECDFLDMEIGFLWEKILKVTTAGAMDAPPEILPAFKGVSDHGDPKDIRDANKAAATAAATCALVGFLDKRFNLAK